MSDPITDFKLTLDPKIDLYKIDTQIYALSNEIDAEPDGPKHDFLCASFQALMWARNPDIHTAPLDMAIKMFQGDVP